ncbi:MAG: metallophosphoesterase [Phycisphaeraceae bacterium]
MHQSTDDRSRIDIEGLERPVRVFHVTDPHLCSIDQRDTPERYEKWKDSRERSGQQFATLLGKPADQPMYPDVTFARTMALASDPAIDLIAITGDLMMFPALASIDAAAAAIARAGRPTLYTSGNHDWFFPRAGSGPTLRQQWMHVLEPFHRGRPDGDSLDIAGLRFLTIDNSTYAVTAEQLAFARRQLADGLPTIVLMHIPLSLPTLRQPVIDKWKDPIMLADLDWPVERRGKWCAQPNTPETLAFADLLRTAPNLVAILCGHVHFAHADRINDHAVQYVGGPGYEGQWRQIELRPAHSQDST